MTVHTSTGNLCGEEGHGARLGVSFRDWKGLEPSANFEEAVWRRIRASTDEPGVPSLAEFLREWVWPHPAWTAAMAAVAVWVGITVGTSTVAGGGHPVSSEPLLGSRTLAGSYLAMNAGGRP